MTSLLDERNALMKQVEIPSIEIYTVQLMDLAEKFFDFGMPMMGLICVEDAKRYAVLEPGRYFRSDRGGYIELYRVEDNQ